MSQAALPLLLINEGSALGAPDELARTDGRTRAMPRRWLPPRAGTAPRSRRAKPDGGAAAEAPGSTLWFPPPPLVGREGTVTISDPWIRNGQPSWPRPTMEARCSVTLPFKTTEIKSVRMAKVACKDRFQSLKNRQLQADFQKS